MSTNIYHVIKDPVHGTMQFTSEEDRWIKPLIDSANIQRLRHIKQLGLADWIFPGAVHTRFSHGIGCCYAASQICNKLGLSNEEKQLVMIAGLLHDIGHGPFSHTFEQIFYKECIHHELWTPMFLQEYSSERFLKQFNDSNPNMPLNEEKLRQIQALIMHEFTDNKLLADIVSSQLDADRLDYLLRDSHFCGVTYGTYDFRWLLHCLTIINTENQQRLGITRKGIAATEEYLMARRLMMRNVYHHGKKHAAERLLKTFLQALAEGLEEGYFSELDENALIQFLKAMNQFNSACANTNNLKLLQQDFIRKNYHLYKQLCDYDVFDLIRTLASWDYNHHAVTIASRLQERKLPKVLYIDKKDFEEANDYISKTCSELNLKPWQLSIVHLPHLSYKPSEDPILLLESENKTKTLHEESLMIGALSDQNESAYLVCIDQALLKTKAGKKAYEFLHAL